MQEDAFRTYLSNRNLATTTQSQSIYALKRIERFYNIDLDAEFDRDQFSSLFQNLIYSKVDMRAHRPNPSKMDIDSDRIYEHLAWYRSHLNHYARFKASENISTADMVGVDDAVVDSNDDLIEEAIGRTFTLEKDLQAALRVRIADLEDGLVVDDGGRERKVEAGLIDILARDKEGVLTVIELKAETAKPESVAQILSYMGSLAEETGEDVRGILVASDHHPRVSHAARAVPNLSLKKYRFKFTFE